MAEIDGKTYRMLIMAALPLIIENATERRKYRFNKVKLKSLIVKN